MDNELQSKLQQRFPVLYRDMGRSNTGMEFGITCPDAWFDLLWRLSEDLEMLDSQLVASQVKEKCGSLRFYLRPSDCGDAEANTTAQHTKDERVFQRINAAEVESTAIVCSHIC